MSTPTPAVSSSAMDTEMVWICSGVLPLAFSSLKKATLASPLRVLNTAWGLASSTFWTRLWASAPLVRGT